MKKLLVLLLLSFSTYAQKDSTIVVRKVDQEAFNYAVNLSKAEGIAKLLPVASFCIFLLLSLNRYKYARKNNITVINDKEIDYLWAMHMCMVVFSGFGVLAFTYSGILHLFAPEWFALKEILKIPK